MFAELTILISLSLSHLLRLKTPLDKPLVVLLSWLMAKQKHLKKYAQLYTDQGFDVLTVQITPWQFMWPKQGAQVTEFDQFPTNWPTNTIHHSQFNHFSN